MNVARIALICLFPLSGLANAQTNFSIQSIQVNPDRSITITWPVLTGTTYQVMFADVLSGPWQDFPDGELTAGTNDLTLSYIDLSAAVVSQRFYRVWRDRPQMVVGLVLDRSYSMATAPPNGSGGAAAMPGAVSAFISCFDENRDLVAMSSFANDAKLNVPMGRPFKTNIVNAVNAMQYWGRTFADGGLQIAFSQDQTAPVLPGKRAVKAVVFFTDGYANTLQDTFSCSPAPLNLGQDDPWGKTNGPWLCNFIDPATGSYVYSCSDDTFLSIDGTTKTISEDNQNVWMEGQLRALATANQIRTANIVIFSIGLGSLINQDLLKQIANDPSSSHFDPSQPAGAAVFAPTPADLQAVFQQIASKVLAYP